MSSKTAANPLIRNNTPGAADVVRCRQKSQASPSIIDARHKRENTRFPKGLEDPERPARQRPVTVLN
jgi:hypothetical protein